MDGCSGVPGGYIPLSAMPSVPWPKGAKGSQNISRLLYSNRGGTQTQISPNDVTVRANGGRNFENEREKWSDGTRTQTAGRISEWRFVEIRLHTSLISQLFWLPALWGSSRSERVDNSSGLILMAQASRRGRGVCFWVCAALCCLTRAAYAQPKYANRLAAESALVADIFGESEEYVTHSRCRIPP